MATITSTSAYELGPQNAKNIREDLGNVIFNVTPFMTPFTSGIAQTKATADNHEWLTDTYADSRDDNAAVEAEKVDSSEGSERTRKGNYVQIATKGVTVTKKAEMFDRAGVPGKEMAYQLMKKGKELQMDVEKQVLSNQIKVIPTNAAAGVSATVSSWILANQKVAADGTLNTASTGLTKPTPGTSEAMTQANLDDLLDGVWDNSGDFSSAKIMGSAGTISTLRNNAEVSKGISTDVTTNAADGEIINRVAVYVSQFGPIAVVPNKHMPADTLYVLDYSTWGLAFAGGKKIHTTDIATQASAEQKLLECYYTLEARSEEANAAYYAINA
ncbi:DUF5309 domain-containing protein [bacterium]|nr:DUF5309 domain-containing protein [Pseudomonadales bacterium]MDB4507472.1 DUF5309 domain-containing protein [bacterium]